MKPAKAISLDTPIQYLKGVGPRMARKLSSLEIFTIENLLYHLPNRHKDLSLKTKIIQAKEGETVTIEGRIISIKNQYLKNRKSIQRAVVEDDTGKIDITWFNQPFLSHTITPDAKMFFSGKINRFLNKLSLVSPDYEFVTKNPVLKYSNINTGRLVPIYPENKQVSSRYLRKLISQSLGLLKENVEEFLPNNLILKNNLISKKEAIEKIHFPTSKLSLKEAEKRLSYDEMFIIQLSLLLKMISRVKGNKSYKLKPFTKKVNSFIKSLPFKLTQAQERTTKEIFSDLLKPSPMNRLLQGDVGSGKTIIAAICAYAVALNKCQTAILVPTEILAFQHFRTFRKLYKTLGIKVALLTGNKKTAKKDKINNYDVLIGTHALLHQKEEYKKLALIIIDEQHRFGVEQRKKLVEEGKKNKQISPHLLTMTATPIPRTIALTLHGDLDLSLLDQLPSGRKKVSTFVVPPNKREKGYLWIEKEIKKHHVQAFIICPFVDPSETMETIKAAKNEFSVLKKTVFPNLKLGLLHGRMKSSEKQIVLEKMNKGKIDILVSTPVVEVGIDIPKATIIMIEAADRFGLAQLHQLRGRVGRGKQRSYCFLFVEKPGVKAAKRLRAMETIKNGIKLAEIDLEVRGPGEIYGIRQHGFTKLKIASLLDSKLINLTRKDAKNLLFKDKSLGRYPLLKKLVFNKNNPLTPTN